MEIEGVSLIEPEQMKKSELKAIVAKGEDSRNPILVSYVAKGLLPYRGLGSGIKRALEEWPDIDFVDDRNGCLFTVTVHRKAVKSSEKTPVKTPVKTLVEILDHLQKNPNDTLFLNI